MPYPSWLMRGSRTNLLVLYIALWVASRITCWTAADIRHSNAGLIIIFSSTWWARYVRQNVSRGQAGSTDPYMNVSASRGCP